MNPADMSLPPLAAAFVFGLLGGAHCIGMCGGIMSALTFAVPPQHATAEAFSRSVARL
jgi:hypothetical protein